MLNRFIKPIEIILNGNARVINTLSGNVDDAVLSLGFMPNDYKVLKTEYSNGKTVATIERTFPVTIMVGKKSVKVKTGSAKVSEILKSAGFKVDKYDMVEPSLDTVITKKAIIDYMDINYVNESSTEVIPYTVKTVFSNALSCGQSYSTEGANGLKLVNYVRKYVNGKEIEKTVSGEQILSNAVNVIKTVGTGGKYPVTTGVAVTTSNYASCYSTISPTSAIPLDENGIPTNYVKHTTVQATAYTFTGHNTSTGKTPQPGYIAVNPNIIPYGTRMYIISSDGSWVYGYAEAADTGGFAYGSPTNVDLFFNTFAQCIAFGRRDIEIYFLP